MLPSRNSRARQVVPPTLTSADVSSRLASTSSSTAGHQETQSTTSMTQRPSTQSVNLRLEAFESNRIAFNNLCRHNKGPGSSDAVRQRALRELADELYAMSLFVFAHIMDLSRFHELKTTNKTPSSTGVVPWFTSWGKTNGKAATSGSNAALPTNVSHLGTDDYTLICSKHTLKVYKKDFGNKRILAWGEFLIPVSPEQYCTYASSLENRRKWDTYLNNAKLIERIDSSTDICYISFRGIGTLSPRECVNLRVIRRINPPDIISTRGTEQTPNGSGASSHDMNNVSTNEKKQSDAESGHGYCSCSCSVVHPDFQETAEKIRADVKAGCYLAEPHEKPGSSELWTKVYIFSEVDPCGWVPTVASKHLAATVLPRTIECVVSCMLDYYGIPWRDTKFYCPKKCAMKVCSNALEYCAMQYHNAQKC